jgi:hypothetical protein
MAVSAAEVVFIATNTAVFVARHGDGFAVVELTGDGDGGKVAKGDQVQGDWGKLGLETVTFGGRKLSSYFHGSSATLDEAVGVARRTSRR